MKRLLLFLALSISVFLFTPQSVRAQEEHLWKRVTQTHPQKIAEYLKVEQTQISAIVGYGQITIEGYTSPEANIQLSSSQGTLGQYKTRSGKDGFFQFSNVVLPKNPGELWLQATDKQGLTSSPIAIPEPPAGLKKIEDIILPPTLAHNNGSFKRGTKALAFGQATPNSQIEVYFFESQSVSWFKKLFLTSPFTPKNAQAQQGEQLSSWQKKLILETDKKGHFSFQLPNQTSQTFRYYAGSIFANNYSPKSNILSFRVLSLVDRLYQQIVLFADKLFSLVLLLLKELLFWIFLEIVALVLLIKKYRSRIDSRFLP